MAAVKSAGPVCEQLGFFPEESRGVSFGNEVGNEVGTMRDEDG